LGKIYEVKEIDKEYLLYIIDGERITEERYLIVDDFDSEYKYPKYCFEIIEE
jgi:hypothetical protein